MPDLSPNKELIYSKALSLLSRREHSAQELSLKLKQRYPENEAEINTVLTELQNKKYLSDQRFAEMITRHRATQGYGPNYIKQELKSHQVSVNEAYLYEDEVVEAFFEGFLRKFQTRFKQVPKTSLEDAKLMKYFLQRGFMREQIKDYLSRIARIK